MRLPAAAQQDEEAECSEEGSGRLGDGRDSNFGKAYAGVCGVWTSSLLIQNFKSQILSGNSAKGINPIGGTSTSAE
jgi:hypothetical protein